MKDNDGLTPKSKGSKRNFRTGRRDRRHKYDHPGYKKSFPKKYTLTRRKKIHLSNGDHICLSCNKPFADKANLARHAYSHAFWKPFPCSYQVSCGKRFEEAKDLTTHLTRIHEGIAAPASESAVSSSSSTTHGASSDEDSNVSDIEGYDDQLNENNNSGFPAISKGEAQMIGNYGDESKLTEAHFFPEVFGIGHMEVPSELTGAQHDLYKERGETSEVYKRFENSSLLNREVDFINYREEIVTNKKFGKMVVGNDLKDINDEKKVISSENKLQELKKRYDVLKDIYPSNSDISTNMTTIKIAIKLHQLMSFKNIVNTIAINPSHFTGLLKAYNQDPAQHQQQGALISPARLLDILKDEDLVGKVISEKFENVTLQQLSINQENENGAGENQSLVSMPSFLVTAGLWSSSSSSSSSSTCSSSVSSSQAYLDKTRLSGLILTDKDQSRTSVTENAFS